MSLTFPIARTPLGVDLVMYAALATRHGLVTGATGTGKTITLQVMTEAFSRMGVPVFVADVKGDLSGLAMPGKGGEKFQARLEKLGINHWQPWACPTVFWDVLGKAGHPVRATVSDMGPLLLSRLLDLNETQTGVLQLIFKIADDKQWLLLDLKDLRAMLTHVTEHAKTYSAEYGNIANASIGAIQRGLLSLSEQGAEQFFGEPMLNIHDLMRISSLGYGQVNILAAEQLMQAPKLYAISLLWLLAELFEQLPEAGDLDKPKLVFFFDEAHLLFTDAPPVLVQKIEQVVRLIRSKGVGVYFVSQNPLDIPESILGQLSNRVQHALRAFTPRDQKAVRSAAQTLRANPGVDVEALIGSLGVGEALVSFLDKEGKPQPVEQAWILPPSSRIGPLTAEERQTCISESSLAGHYEQNIDRFSAYEILSQAPTTQQTQHVGELARNNTAHTSPKGKHNNPTLDAVTEVAGKLAISFGRKLGQELVRGLLGSLMGGTRNRR